MRDPPKPPPGLMGIASVAKDDCWVVFYRLDGLNMFYTFWRKELPARALVFALLTEVPPMVAFELRDYASFAWKPTKSLALYPFLLNIVACCCGLKEPIFAFLGGLF